MHIKGLRVIWCVERCQEPMPGLMLFCSEAAERPEEASQPPSPSSLGVLTWLTELIQGETQVLFWLLLFSLLLSPLAEQS